MIKKLFLLIILLICTLAAVLWQFWAKADEQVEVNPSKEEPRMSAINKAIPHNDLFYQEGVFRDAVKKSEQHYEATGIRSIIIPHHLLASDIIADLVSESSDSKSKRIFIIGPNHENIGVSALASTIADWETPFGRIENDQLTTKSLSADLRIALNDSVFYNEHSIGGILPFVKHYLPEAKIIPIAVSSYAEIGDMRTLNRWLSENLEEDDLVIFSLDFSHYLTKGQAEAKDKETEAMIRASDTDKISRLTNDHVDAPMILVLALLQARDREWNIDIIHHANSFDYSMGKSQYTTSYFGIVFYEKIKSNL